MKIYVVIGSTGEYSDRTEWLVKAFKSERRAQNFVKKVDARAKEIFAIRDSQHFLTLSGIDSENNKFDPDMRMDYSGTNYNYEEVELVE